MYGLKITSCKEWDTPIKTKFSSIATLSISFKDYLAYKKEIPSNIIASLLQNKCICPCITSIK